eukprot:scaffold6486_cov96-Cylindrotheca_fusiformis.AAC.7
MALFFIYFLVAVHEASGFSTPRIFHVFGRRSEANLVATNSNSCLMERDMDDEIQDLLNKRRVVETNKATSHLKSSLPGVMETVSFPESGSIVFRKGDRSSGLYFVEAGIFECVNCEGNVVAVLNEDDLFGELEIFFAEPRELTVRSASPGSNVWFVNVEAYNLLSQVMGDSPAVHGNLEDEYKDSMDFRAKRRAIQSFKPLRKHLSSDEIDRVAQILAREFFEAGQDVVMQGSEDGLMYMYFLDSGTFEAYDADTGNVVSTYSTTRTGYFGELAFFLDRPRSKSIRASTPGSLLVLSRTDLFKIVNKEIVDDDFLSLLKDKYREASLADKCKQLAEYLKNKSRNQSVSIPLYQSLLPAPI